MSDEDQAQDTENLVAPDEMETLKARATMMGLKFHPSISLDKLREKVIAAMSDEPKKEEDTVAETKTVELTANQKRKQVKDEATKLIRVNIACNNPAKREWQGELFTVGNAAVATIKKFVPFNTEDGWHIPQIMLNMIRGRQCQVFETIQHKDGSKSRRGKLIKEFNVEILPDLTEEELKELARRQAMAAGETV